MHTESLMLKVRKNIFYFKNNIRVSIFVKRFNILLTTLDSWSKEIFQLTTHSTYFIYCYKTSDIDKRPLISREETSCHKSNIFTKARIMAYIQAQKAMYFLSYKADINIVLLSIN